MPYDGTSYGDILPRTAVNAVKRFLKRGQRGTIVDKFSQRVIMPRNKSQTLKFRRYNSLGKAVTPLTEGVMPAVQKLTCTDVTSQIHQYGGVVEISDVIVETHEDPVFNESVKLVGEQAGESMEAVKIGVLNAGTNRFYCGGTSRATVSGVINLPTLRLVNRSFRRNLAKKITSIIKAGVDVSTEPVGASYILMGHTDLETDFRNITGFLPVEKYAGDQRISEFEIGKVENFRILLTSEFIPVYQAGASGTNLLSNGTIPASAAAADVYQVIAVAENAYAFTPLGGYESAKIVAFNPAPSKDDVLGQHGYVGWKTWMGGAILNDTWMAVIETGCSASY